jgi:hypothetical protein
VAAFEAGAGADEGDEVGCVHCSPAGLGGLDELEDHGEGSGRAASAADVADNTLWVAALTAGTAVLASWVTSRGNANAARLQAEAATESQQLARQREARRAAYAAVIDKAVAIGELYWKIPEAARTADPDGRRTELLRLREQIRDVYAALLRCVQVVVLEGPDDVAEAAAALDKATPSTARLMRAMADGDTAAEEQLTEETRAYWPAMTEFIERASKAVRAM